MVDAAKFQQSLDNEIDRVEQFVESAKLHVQGQVDCLAFVEPTSEGALDYDVDQEVGKQCVFLRQIHHNVLHIAKDSAEHRVSDEPDCLLLCPASHLRRLTNTGLSAFDRFETVGGSFVLHSRYGTFISSDVLGEEGSFKLFKEQMNDQIRSNAAHFCRSMPTLLVSAAVRFGDATTRDHIAQLADDQLINFVLRGSDDTFTTLHAITTGSVVWELVVGPLKSWNANLIELVCTRDSRPAERWIELSASTAVNKEKFSAPHRIDLCEFPTEHVLPPTRIRKESLIQTYPACRQATLRGHWETLRESIGDWIRPKAVERDWHLITERVTLGRFFVECVQYPVGSYWPELLDLWPASEFEFHALQLDDALRAQAILRVIDAECLFPQSVPNSATMPEIALSRWRKENDRKFSEAATRFLYPMYFSRTKTDTDRALKTVLVVSDFGKHEAAWLEFVTERFRTDRRVLYEPWRLLFDAGVDGLDAVVLLYDNTEFQQLANEWPVRTRASDQLQVDERPVETRHATTEHAEQLREYSIAACSALPSHSVTDVTNLIMFYRHVLPFRDGRSAPAEFLDPTFMDDFLGHIREPLGHSFDLQDSAASNQTFKERVEAFEQRVRGEITSDNMSQRHEKWRQEIEGLRRAVEGRLRSANAGDGPVKGAKSVVDSCFRGISTLVSKSLGGLDAAGDLWNPVTIEAQEIRGLADDFMTETDVGIFGEDAPDIDRVLHEMAELGYLARNDGGYDVLKPFCFLVLQRGLTSEGPSLV